MIYTPPPKKKKKKRQAPSLPHPPRLNRGRANGPIKILAATARGFIEKNGKSPGF